MSKGWSDRGAKSTEEPVMPEEIFSVLSIAHDRLFPLIDAACIHGGAGTVGACLRAGLPTLIHPFVRLHFINYGRHVLIFFFTPFCFSLNSSGINFSGVLEFKN